MRSVPIFYQPNTRNKHPQHKVGPDLVRTVAIDRPSRIWCAEMTYIPTQRGFLYLAALVDWYSRKGLGWQLSNARDAEACAEALKKALAKTRHTGDIHHGSRQPVHQWRLDRRVDVSTDAKVKNSIGGKGRWIDNRVIDNRKLGNHRVGNRRI